MYHKEQLCGSARNDDRLGPLPLGVAQTKESSR
uniref:Uncharacterized protein n=1 Tax=Anguilla anguilla TaxID=7936 RepID=A0A0E9QYP5_ANGAN